MHLEDNIFNLYQDLCNNTYKHSSYKHFQIFDNKKRDIYKAEVRDRIVHQIIFNYLLLLFEKDFISDSYASRINKGQYKAISALCYFVKLASNKNHNKCFILKCDVRKYFDSIDQGVLLDLIKEKVVCSRTFEIIKDVVFSFQSVSEINKGIPLGNITSQIFANMYLNILDKYVKKDLRCRFYVRYNDDFIIVSDNNKKLIEIRDKIIVFVKQKLLLEIPIEKTCIRKIGWGIDFLGFTILPKMILLRNKTKNKIYANISIKNHDSYFSILKHCASYNLNRKILSMERFEENDTIPI